VLLLVVASFAAGFLSKVSDMVADDGMRLARLLGIAVGVSYGFMVSLVMTHYAILSPLVIAVVLGTMLTGKIDHEVHYAGVGSMLLFVSLIGLPPVNPWLLAVFMAGGIIDEIGSDLADRKRISRIPSAFFRYRLTMEVLTLAVSVFCRDYMFFIAMLSADAGYTYLFSGLRAARLIRVRRQ